MQGSTRGAAMKRVLTCASLILCSVLPVAAQTSFGDLRVADTIAIQSSEPVNLDQAPPQQPEPKTEAAPEHLSASCKSRCRDSASDLVAFPKRRSTWTILGMGAVAALAVHPADDYV